MFLKINTLLTNPNYAMDASAHVDTRSFDTDVFTEKTLFSLGWITRVRKSKVGSFVIKLAVLFSLLVYLYNCQSCLILLKALLRSLP